MTNKFLRTYRSFFKKTEEPDLHSSISFLQQKIAPLKLEILDNVEKKVNILIPTLDFKYFFGGYIGKFNLAKKLALEKNKVRLIIVDSCQIDPNLWKKEISHYKGLEDFFDIVEVSYAFDRTKFIEISKNDNFIATTWWTAQIANEAIKQQNRKKFIYFIQEYEPFTFVHGSYYALADETYSFPHFAIFSTELLREYFQHNRIGVFKNNIEEGLQNSISFQNAITTFEVNKNILQNRKKRKLLFYARPEPHAARNMFEMGILAISNAIENDYFDTNDWEFHGIGAVSNYENLKIAKDIEIKLIPRTSFDEYKKLLSNYDIGLSLMLTPHPNLLTIEMAAAGMIVVTNTFENKTQEKLSKISANIISCQPTIKEISDCLSLAKNKVENYEQRIKGAEVSWAKNWDEAFNQEKMDKIVEFLKK